MSALHLLQQGFLIAAESAALLFVTPAAAAPAARASAPSLPAVHIVATRFDLQLLGSLAALRTSHTVENSGPQPVDLAAWLPEADAPIDALRITRGARTVELLDGGCGADEAELDDHAVLAGDEAIADLMQLPHGAAARIETEAVQVLDGSAGVYRLAAPGLRATDPSYLTGADGATRFLAIAVPAGSVGTAALTLRPRSGPTRRIALGTLDGAATVVVLTLADAAELAALDDGAVELEIEAAEAAHWVTVSRQASASVDAPVLARSAQ